MTYFILGICIFAGPSRSQFLEAPLDTGVYHLHHSLFALDAALSIRLPSSSCSLTVRSGNSAGMILRGVEPSTRAYFPKSETPLSLRKSSSRRQRPLTSFGGELSIARMASEKIDGLRSSERLTCGPCVAAESIAYFNISHPTRILFCSRTAAGQRLVIAMLDLSSRSKSTAMPIVNADTAQC